MTPNIRKSPHRGTEKPLSLIRVSRFRLTLLPCLLTLVTLVAAVLTNPPRVQAQELELNGGYNHNTGDFGLDGFTVGTGWWFTPRISVGVNYDSGWDTSSLGTFELTSAGQIAIKSHLQNFLVGPRILFPHVISSKYKLSPFAEFQIGGTHLSQKIQQVTTGSQSASANSFSWLLGGGVDYPFNAHWSGRGSLALLRTHLANSGQSRLRLGLGVAYTFGRH